MCHRSTTCAVIRRNVETDFRLAIKGQWLVHWHSSHEFNSWVERVFFTPLCYSLRILTPGPILRMAPCMLIQVCRSCLFPCCMHIFIYLIPCNGSSSNTLETIYRHPWATWAGLYSKWFPQSCIYMYTPPLHMYVHVYTSCRKNVLYTRTNVTHLVR